MNWPPLLFDEDFPADVARALRAQGSSTVEITAEGTGRAAGDATQVDRIAALGGVLISHNQTERGKFRDFVRAWRERGNATTCVAFLPHDSDRLRLHLRTLLLLEWYASRPLPKPETLVWNDVAQPLIGGYRPAGYTEAHIRYALGQGPRPTE